MTIHRQALRQIHGFIEEDCPLAGRTYFGRHPYPQCTLDGRVIEVLGWCNILDDPQGQRFLMVADSTNRVWSTKLEGVERELKEQESWHLSSG